MFLICLFITEIESYGFPGLTLDFCPHKKDPLISTFQVLGTILVQVHNDDS